MAKVGIFEEPPKKWFQFDNDTEFLIQYLDKGKVNSILLQGAEAAKKMKAKASNVQDIFLGKEALHGWRQIGNEEHPGLLDPTGEPIPFSGENRNRLMVKSQLVSEFVFKVCTDERRFLEEDLPALEADDLKGLEELLEEMGKEETPGNG